METQNAMTVSTVKLEHVLEHKDSPILKYTIKYPRFSSKEHAGAARKISNCYKKMALGYQKYLRSSLLKSAMADYQFSIKNGYPVHEYEAVLSFSVPYLQDCTASLYTQRYEYTGGAHGSTRQASQTWSMESGRQLSLPELFPKNPNYLTAIKGDIQAQIVRQIGAGGDVYFDNPDRLVDQTFSPDQFYLTPEGLAVYFQQYDIAPYATDIPTFLMPYDKINAQLPQCN